MRKFRKMTEMDKKTRTEKVETLLFSLQLVCVIINVFCSIWQYHRIVSITLALSFIITTALAFIAIANKNNKYTVVIWIFITLLSYLSASQGKPNITFGYMKEWIIFISTINLYFWVFSINVNKKMINRLFLCGVITAIIFIVAFFTGKDKSNVQMSNLVTFGLSNPNLAGIYLLNVFLCIFNLIVFTKNPLLKTFFLFLCGILFYFICLTNARSCIIASIACIFFSILPARKYNKHLTLAILIFPLVFVFIYLRLIETDWASIFRFMESEGKSLTSRIKIWENTIYIIKNNLFLGNYYLGSGNRHNTHLMILSAFGTITFTLLIIFLNRITNYIGSFVKNRYQITAIYCFYAIILMGTFEAALFSGSQEMYVFSGFFLMIAKYVNNKDSIKEELQEKLIK